MILYINSIGSIDRYSYYCKLRLISIYGVDNYYSNASVRFRASRSIR